MTAPSVRGIARCLASAMERAGVHPGDVDLVSGHLTATHFDPIEIELWVEALGRSQRKFPLVNSLKSMVGHCLSAAGAIESIAVVLQLRDGFLHPSLNCEDLHPDIALRIDRGRVPEEYREESLRIAAKSSFGFGDVNSCILFQAYP